MTLAELQRATINPEIAREAYAQAEKRLGDALDTKEGHEKKAFEMLRSYVVVSLAAFGAAGFCIRGGYTELGPPLFLAGMAFTVGAGLALFALKARAYGAIGSDPSMWLVSSVIDGDDSRVLPAMLATVTFFHEQRIQESRQSNAKKGALVYGSVWIGTLTPVVLGLWILLLGM